MSTEPAAQRSIAWGANLATAVSDFFASVRRNRALILELVLRDVKGAHAGHGLGSLWVYAQPLVVIVTYMLIFGVVIGSKIAMTATFPGDYTSYVVIGLTPWLLMANALGRAPGIFIANSNLVKQVVFPIEVLPVANGASCFLVLAPAIAVMVAYKLFFGGGLTAYVLLLPVALAMHAVLVVGIMLLLSVITPFVRDIREIVTIYLTVSMYFTPAVYLPDWVPEAIRPLLYLNPFSYVVWVYQDVLFFGVINHPFAWVVLAVMAVAALLGGLMIFRKIRPYLGNVL